MCSTCVPTGVCFAADGNARCLPLPSPARTYSLETDHQQATEQAVICLLDQVQACAVSFEVFPETVEW